MPTNSLWSQRNYINGTKITKETMWVHGRRVKIKTIAHRRGYTTRTTTIKEIIDIGGDRVHVKVTIHDDGSVTKASTARHGITQSITYPRGSATVDYNRDPLDGPLIRVSSRAQPIHTTYTRTINFIVFKFRTGRAEPSVQTRN